MDAFVYQFGKIDTLASQMAAGATSATLSSGNFTTFTADYLILDYNNASKREVILCNVAGTAVTSATRGVQGSDVTHSAGAAVAYGWIPNHADYAKNALVSGWTDASIVETWVYASASTFTVAGVDVTAKYTKGTKLRLKQGAGYKYYTVASSTFSTNTTVTVIVNTDYTIANAAITDEAYSYIENPQAFPHWFAYAPGGIAASNVTVTGRYRVSGRTCFGEIRAAFTGAITFSTMPVLPVAASASLLGVAGGALLRGSGGYTDSGAADVLDTIFPTFAASATLCSIVISTTAAISATVPVTWANNDELRVKFDYEF